MLNSLKYIRRVLAAIFFIPITLYFLDFNGLLPNQLHHLLEVQWLPALLSLNFVILIFLFLLSLLFGRIYCSVICPLGIFQDVVHRKSSWFIKKKNRYRTVYVKPKSVLRYIILSIFTLSLFFGFGGIVSLLDPYSIFGRICSQMLLPLFVYLNNLLVDSLATIGIYSLDKVEQVQFVPMVFVITVLFFILISLMSWFRGRLFCNTICPVGTFLGLFSKYSLFKIAIKENACTQCSACEKHCKSQCIDSLKKKLDDSRCVTCFNCLSVCKKGALKYEYRYLKKSSDVEVSNASKANSRRTFMLTSGGIIAGLATAKADQLIGKQDFILTRKAIMPPGAINRERFNRKCTGCQLCVTKCPMHVLKPASLEYGVLGVMQPHLHFSKHVYCDFECTICTEVCPTGALRKLKKEEKKLAQIGVAVFRKNKCVVLLDEKDCGACADHCPTQAVHMAHYKNGKTIPEVTTDLCIGCGACESICPAKPHKAIYVDGLTTQVNAKKTEDAEHFNKK